MSQANFLKFLILAVLVHGMGQCSVLAQTSVGKFDSLASQYAENNLLKNPSFEDKAGSGYSKWTIATGTPTVTNWPDDGKKALAVSLSAATGYVACQDYTIVSSPDMWQGANIEASGLFATSSTGAELCLMVDNVEYSCASIPTSPGALIPVSVYMPGPLNGVTDFGVCTKVTSFTGTLLHDKMYLGRQKTLAAAVGILPGYVGESKISATSSCTFNTTGTWANYSANASCPTATAKGKVTAPPTKRPAVTIPSIKAGFYKFTLVGSITTGGSGRCKMRFYDGTRASNIGVTIGIGSGQDGPVFTGIIEYASDVPAGVTVDFQMNLDAGATCQVSADNGDALILVEYSPPPNQVVGLAVPAEDADTGWVSAGVNTVTATTTAPTKGTTTVDRFLWRRSGPDLIARIEYIQSGSGSGGSGDYLWAVPASVGCTMDTSTVTPYTTISNLSMSNRIGSATVASTTGSANGEGPVVLYDATRVRFYVDSTSSNLASISSAWFSFGAVNAYTATFTVPCSNWKNTQRAPTLTGGVTAPRVNATVGTFFAQTLPTANCSTSPCPLDNDASDGVLSITRSTTGTYAATVPSGVCRKSLSCVPSSGNNAATAATCTGARSLSSATSYPIVCVTDAGAFIDSVFAVRCNCLL